MAVRSTVDPTAQIHGRFSLISAVGHDKALDVSGNSSATGTKVQIWDHHPEAAQTFSFRHMGDGWHQIVHGSSGKVLTVAEGDAAFGTRVILGRARGDAGQLWRFEPHADRYRFLSALGYYLDVCGASPYAGTCVQIWGGNSTAAQLWSLERKEDVFISYHRATAREIVQQIVGALGEKDISYWYDEEGVDAGHYAGKIVRAIDQCRVFLLILDRGSNGSKDVLSEVALAYERMKKGGDITISPIVVDDCKMSDDLRYYLAGLDRIDLGHAPDMDEIRHLVERVERLLGRR